MTLTMQYKIFTRVHHVRVLLLFTVGVLFVVTTTTADTKADIVNEPLAQKIETNQEKEDRQKSELQKRFEILKAQAEDETLEDNVRVDKFLEIGNLELSAATQYLIDHIDYHIPKRRWSSDDDFLREYPCYYALLRKKDKVLPEVLIWLENTRNDVSVKWITRLLDYTVGIETATESLQKREQEVKDDPDYSVLVKNIKQVTQQLEEIRELREKERQWD